MKPETPHRPSSLHLETMHMSLSYWKKSLLGAVLLLGAGVVPAATDGAQRFDSVFEALDSFFEALNADDESELRTIFGPAGETLLRSGDPVDDANDRASFRESFESKLSLVRLGPDEVGLRVGAEDWPFPIPLRHDEKGWYFDTEAGREELLNRRIGGNELDTLGVVRAFVDAQYEYAQRDPDGDGVQVYAQRFGSAEGQRDGLYWPVGEGEQPSPMGPLMAAAAAEGYAGGQGGPYHGYRYRILTAQGESAPGGARSYLQDGKLTEGFALVAYPAQYGVSGVMTFQVNQQGIVFQKDLGPETEQLVAQMQAYDPAAGWEPTGDGPR